jgi:hypothetical protein
MNSTHVWLPSMWRGSPTSRRRSRTATGTEIGTATDPATLIGMPPGTQPVTSAETRRVISSMTVMSGATELEVPMTDAEMAQNRAEIDRLKARAPRPEKTRADWAIQIVRDFCALVALVALSIGIANIVAQNRAVACQASLLQNLSAQNAAGVESGNAIQNAAQVLADSEAAQAADLATVLDMTQTQDARRAALDDFRAQSGAVAQAWSTYVAARKAADKKRAANPVTFRC